MKYYSSLLITIFSTAIFLTSCKKNSTNPVDQLPPITTEGKNTFGCLIDGKPFSINEITDSTYAWAIVTWDTSVFHPLFGMLLFTGKIRDPENSITFEIEAVKKTKIYSGDTIKMSDGISYGDDKGATGDYKYRYENSTLWFSTKFATYPPKGEVVYLKFDQLTHIISGTFWYDADDGAGNIVHITNGRFDIKID